MLIKGVSGKFKFSTEFKGSKADLVSVSPRIFFIRMRTILIAIGVIKDKPFGTRVTERTLTIQAESPATAEDSAVKPKRP